jgi:transcriptional regulator with XRE-family HTH domain
VNEIGSTVPRRQLGRHLRQLREEAGISLEAAGRRLEWSKAKMYRIEGGQTALRTHDVLAMCSVYSAPTDLTDVLVGLAAETKAKGWWHAYGEVVPDWYHLYVSMENAASSMRWYEPGLVPGLLQTTEYAEAIISDTRGISRELLDQRVALRMERQRLLTRKQPRAPRLDAVIEEAALRRPIADRVAMQRQLQALAGASDASNINVRVLPSVRGTHRVLVAGAFVVFNFDGIGARQPEPTTIYSESLTGALYLDKPAEVEQYEDAWGALDELALSTEESAAMLEKIAEEIVDD